MKKQLLLLVCIMLFASCKPVLKTLYGIKNPKLTTKEVTQRFLDKKKLEGKVLYYKGAESYILAQKTITLPDAQFFNKEGELVEFRNTASECTNDVTVFLEGLNELEDLPLKKGMDLATLLKFTTDEKGNVVHPNADADMTVVINWATYMGSLNKTVFEWVEVLQQIEKEHKNINVDYYLLNLDMLESWEDVELLTGKK